MKFSSQPFTSRFGISLNNIIKSGDWNQIDIAVAWVRKSGIKHLRVAIEEYLSDGKALRIIVGVDLGNTTKEGLEELLTLSEKGALEVFIHHNEEPRTVFHPKVYLFRSNSSAKLIIGSNNLTESGLYKNTEAGVEIDLAPTHPLIESTLSALKTWSDIESGISKKLDKELLAELLENEYVVDEASLNNLIREQESDKSAKREKGKKLFSRIPTTPPEIKRAKPSSSKLLKKKVTEQNKSTGEVLLMRIRTSRGTQSQIPKKVRQSNFFTGISEVTSFHSGEAHGIHEAKSHGSVNTLKLEIPETKGMDDPVIRFERLPKEIYYRVYDSDSPEGILIMTTLNEGLELSPKETLLTKPSSPDSSTWWRFI